MMQLILVLAFSAAAIQESTHLFTVNDMLAMDRIMDPQVSPDGISVLFTVRETDIEANRGKTDVYLAAIDGSSLRRLTTNASPDSNARWLPGGDALVFLSSRSGSNQVWKMSLQGGEPEQLTRFPIGIDNMAVFPDGKRLLLSMEVYPELASLDETAKREQEAESSKVRGRVYDSLMFRHWDTWEDGKRSHWFTWQVGSSTAPIDLMKGMVMDAPTKPFGGLEEAAIHPSGSDVVFAAKDEARANAWSTNIDLWRVPADGSKAPVRITSANKGMDNSPSFSPDGNTLAYLAMARPGYEADRQRIQLLDWKSGALRSLTESWDRSVSELCWSKDGTGIFATADNIGNKSLFFVKSSDGAVQTLVEKGTCASLSPTNHGVLFGHDTLLSPVELLHCEAIGQTPKPVTRLNESKVKSARMGKYEQFSFPGAKGDVVYGYVVKPADFTEGRKYPVAFLIHGGPQGSFGDHFHYRWNPQAYAGAGYAAVMIDFHGSTGYGQAFTDAIGGDWGGKPFEDLMLGLDFAIAKYPFLDGGRVAALGASFGGYMINWIAGHTDRFKCLVNHDGNLDERMAYFDTEELWFPEWDHGGLPWEHPEHYAKHNPIDHVQNWKTPMLVIHGALDYRVVDTQGMSTFTALQRRGIPSKFLYFPDENHWVLKPQNSQLWHQTVLGWLEQWCR